MININESYTDFLKHEYQVRVSINQAYSLRAYARDLGISSGRLNDILNNKQGLSFKSAKSIAEKLKLSAKETEIFILMVEAKHARSKEKKLIAKSKLQSIQSEHFSEIVLENFKILSEWYHFAILELLEFKDFKNDFAWISEKLGIKEYEVKSAIERLKRTGLLREKNGKLTASENFTTTPENIPSNAAKFHHKQLLERAIQKLFFSPIDERDFSSVILAFDKNKIKEAQEELKIFRRKFCKKMNEYQNKNSIYALTLNFFELK